MDAIHAAVDVAVAIGAQTVFLLQIQGKTKPAVVTLPHGGSFPFFGVSSVKRLCKLLHSLPTKGSG